MPCCIRQVPGGEPSAMPARLDLISHTGSSNFLFLLCITNCLPTNWEADNTPANTSALALALAPSSSFSRLKTNLTHCQSHTSHSLLRDQPEPPALCTPPQCLFLKLQRKPLATSPPSAPTCRWARATFLRRAPDNLPLKSSPRQALW